MKTATTSLVRVLLLASLLSACQTPSVSEDGQQRRERELAEYLQHKKLVVGAPARNLFNFTVNGFQAINDMNLVVYANVKDRYLVTLTMPCNDLPYAIFIGLGTYSSVVNNFDDLLVRKNATLQQLCKIKEIFQLTDNKNAQPG